jgi:hypothetical protein
MNPDRIKANSDDLQARLTLQKQHFDAASISAHLKISINRVAAYHLVMEFWN